MGGKMKIFSFGVVLTTLFTSFVSLAGTLVINNNQSDPRAKEVMYAFIDAFDKAHPEVTVVVNDFDHEEYKVAIRNFLQADAPDIAVWFAGNRMKFFVDQGLFEDVSDVWESAGLNDSMAASKGSLTVDGKQYGVPYAYYQWGVYYRKDIFDKLGLNEPRDFEEFKWVCAMLKKNGYTPITIGTKYLWTAAAWFDYMNMRINGYNFHMDLMAGNASYEDPRLDDVFDG
jgi:multiple sugar transport system substrate-binding protein